MKIEVINTGTELLLGNTQNTHGAWLGRELFVLGLRIARQTCVPDGFAIRDALQEAVLRSDVVIVTGGLGPTSDDLTREIAAEVLGLELIEDSQSLLALRKFFEVLGKPMADSNLKQALCPVGADILPNPHGTAPGIYLPPRINPQASCAVFLLPGPPRELYPMYFAEVLPRLQVMAGIDSIPEALVLKFTGVGESDFHQGIDGKLGMIADLEFGYCAHIGEVDLRLIGSPATIAAARNLTLEHFERYLISENGMSMEGVVVQLLKSKGLTLAIAESCTGGMISNRITNVPGASEVFTHGFITYSNRAKTELLGVSETTLASQGAVSEEVAREMAVGALNASNADIAVSVTGIAGPDGGTDEKPVGLAWIGLATKDGRIDTHRIFHPRNRKDFKLAASQSALEQARRCLKTM